MSESDARDGEVIAPVQRQMPMGRRFQPGNPGRPKGSRNKLGEHFIAALCADFEAHGVRVIERVREEEPSVYLRVIARVVPPAMLVQERYSVVSELSDEQVLAYVSVLDEMIAAQDREAR